MDLHFSPKKGAKLIVGKIEPKNTNRQVTFQRFVRWPFYPILTKQLLYAWVQAAWKRARVRWKGLMLQFPGKFFWVFCRCFCAKFSLGFAVRGVFLAYFDFSSPIKMAILPYFAQKSCYTHGCKPPGNVRECAGKVYRSQKKTLSNW